MTIGQAEVEAQKKAAADRALELVRPGTVVGLGSGSTARYFIAGLADRVRAGLKVRAVATSAESRRLAEEGRIAITERIDGHLDLAVDRVHELDPSVYCLIGPGVSLLREKIAAVASRGSVLIADESKLVGRLGRGPVPIEVLPFLWEATSRAIESLGGRPQLRMANGRPFRTDNDNLILDTSFGAVDAPLGTAIHAIPGVLEHGLFFGMARAAFVGSATGVRVLGELA